MLPKVDGGDDVNVSRVTVAVTAGNVRVSTDVPVANRQTLRMAVPGVTPANVIVVAVTVPVVEPEGAVAAQVVLPGPKYALVIPEKLPLTFTVAVVAVKANAAVLAAFWRVFVSTTRVPTDPTVGAVPVKRVPLDGLGTSITGLAATGVTICCELEVAMIAVLAVASLSAVVARPETWALRRIDPAAEAKAVAPVIWNAPRVAVAMVTAVVTL